MEIKKKIIKKCNVHSFTYAEKCIKKNLNVRVEFQVQEESDYF